jgi:hypothetical protein
VVCPSGSSIKPLYAFHLPPCVLHALSILLDLMILIILGEEYKLWSSALCSFLQPPVTSSLFGPNIPLLSALFSNTLSQYSSPQRPVLKHSQPIFLSVNVTEQLSHSYKSKGNIIIFYIIILAFLDRRREDKKHFQVNGRKHYPNTIRLQTLIKIMSTKLSSNAVFVAFVWFCLYTRISTGLRTFRDRNVSWTYDICRN